MIFLYLISFLEWQHTTFDKGCF